MPSDKERQNENETDKSFCFFESATSTFKYHSQNFNFMPVEFLKELLEKV